MTAQESKSTHCLPTLVLSVSMGIGVLTSCAADDGMHQAALKDLQQERNRAIQRDRDVQARDQEIQTLNRRLEEAEVERAGAHKALANAASSMEDLARAQSLARERAVQFLSLVAQFGKMTRDGKLSVEVRGNRVVVNLVDRILFDPGKAQLKREGAEALEEVIAVLKDVPNRDFQVSGHTDNLPTRSTRFRSNWDLSTARAVEVVNFMVTSGMEPRRLSAAGYADQVPIGSNDTSEGRMRNRRIEIMFMPNPDDLPAISTDNAGAPPPEAPPSAPEPPFGTWEVPAVGGHLASKPGLLQRAPKTSDGD